jgi:hypothetical protein
MMFAKQGIPMPRTLLLILLSSVLACYKPAVVPAPLPAKPAVKQPEADYNGLTRPLSLLLQKHPPFGRIPIGSGYLDLDSVFDKSIFSALDCDSVINTYLSTEDTTSPDWRISLPVEKTYDELCDIMKAEIERKLKAYLGIDSGAVTSVYMNALSVDTGEPAVLFCGGMQLDDTAGLTAQFADSGNYLSTKFGYHFSVYLKTDFSILFYPGKELSSDSSESNHSIAFRVLELKAGIGTSEDDDGADAEADEENEETEGDGDEAEDDPSDGITWDTAQQVTVHFGIWDWMAEVKKIHWSAMYALTLASEGGREVYAPAALEATEVYSEPLPFITINDVRSRAYEWSIYGPQQPYSFSATLQCVPDYTEYPAADTIEDSLRLKITQNNDYSFITSELEIAGEMRLGRIFDFSCGQVQLTRPRISDHYKFPDTYAHTHESTLYGDSVFVTLPDSIGRLTATESDFILNGKVNRTRYHGNLYYWKFNIPRLMRIGGWRIGINGTIKEPAWSSSGHSDTVSVNLDCYNGYRLCVVSPSGRPTSWADTGAFLKLSTKQINIRNCIIAGTDTLVMNSRKINNPVFTFSNVSYILHKGFSGSITMQGTCYVGGKKVENVIMTYDLKTGRLTD